MAALRNMSLDPGESLARVGRNWFWRSYECMRACLCFHSGSSSSSPFCFCFRSCRRRLGAAECEFICQLASERASTQAGKRTN